MKRLIALLLAAVLSLSLAACGSKTEDDTLDVSDENVIEATWQDVFNDVKENEAKACNNTYKVTGSIDKIKSDCCVVGALYVYLPSDILASIDTDKTPEITFIGKITDVYSEEGYYEGGAVIIEFGDAELVELHGVSEDSEYEILTEDKFSEDMTGKTYKFTACNVEIVDEGCIGTLEIMNNGEIVNCPYSDTNTAYLIYLSEDEVKNIKSGDNVNIIGIVSNEDIGTGNDGPYASFAFKPAMVVNN